jgi:hypothetical protein
VSKDSVVCLPHKLTHQLGGISPVCLVHRVTNCIHLMDPATTQSKGSGISNGTESEIISLQANRLFFFILLKAKTSTLFTSS